MFRLHRVRSRTAPRRSCLTPSYSRRAASNWSSSLAKASARACSVPCSQASSTSVEKSCCSSTSPRIAPTSPTTSSNMLIFSSRMRSTASSMVPAVTRLKTNTSRVWPIRSIRPMRCSMAIGFQGMSKLISVLQNCRLRPSPPDSVHSSTGTASRKASTAASFCGTGHVAGEDRERRLLAAQPLGQMASAVAMMHEHQLLLGPGSAPAAEAARLPWRRRQWRGSGPAVPSSAGRPAWRSAKRAIAAAAAAGEEPAAASRCCSDRRCGAASAGRRRPRSPPGRGPAPTAPRSRPPLSASGTARRVEACRRGMRRAASARVLRTITPRIRSRSRSRFAGSRGLPGDHVDRAELLLRLEDAGLQQRQQVVQFQQAVLHGRGGQQQQEAFCRLFTRR